MSWLIWNFVLFDPTSQKIFVALFEVPTVFSESAFLFVAFSTFLTLDDPVDFSCLDQYREQCVLLYRLFIGFEHLPKRQTIEKNDYKTPSLYFLLTFFSFGLGSFSKRFKCLFRYLSLSVAVFGITVGIEIIGHARCRGREQP